MAQQKAVLVIKINTRRHPYTSHLMIDDMYVVSDISFPITTTLVLIFFCYCHPYFSYTCTILCMHDGTGIIACATEAIHVIIPCACTCAARGKVKSVLSIFLFVYLSVYLSAQKSPDLKICSRV